MEVIDRNQHAVAMEKFRGDDQSKEVCIGKLHECDALVLILGERYGTLDPVEKVSITEFEYTTAKALGVPVFAFLKTRGDGSWQSTEIEADRIKKHLAFKNRVDNEKYRKEFQTCDQLKIEILGAVANHERQRGELGVQSPPSLHRVNSSNHFLTLRNYLIIVGPSLAERRRSPRFTGLLHPSDASR